MTISETLFEAYAKAKGNVVIRFNDTADTKEIRASQPADYLLVSDKGISFAEVKETKQSTFSWGEMPCFS